MTIDQLRARKRELLERRQRLEQDGDKLALALVREELLDVTAQLRTMTHGRRRRGRDTAGQWESDKKQYEDWAVRMDAAEGQARAVLREKAAASLEELTGKQREALELYASGMNVIQIAEKLGVNKSTVSRNLSRAKKNAAGTIQLAVEGEKLLAGADSVDLSKEDALRAVVLSLTPKQLVYFYLYYSEGLTLREVEELTGTDHTSVCRTIKRALLRLDRLFPGGAILENQEALDEAAYWVWRELDAHPELSPEPVLALVRKPRPAGYYRKYDHTTADVKPHVMIRRAKRQAPGKLLASLLEQTGSGLFRWLERVFEVLRRRWDRSQKWRMKTYANHQ